MPALNPLYVFQFATCRPYWAIETACNNLGWSESWKYRSAVFCYNNNASLFTTAKSWNLNTEWIGVHLYYYVIRVLDEHRQAMFEDHSFRIGSYLPHDFTR